MFDDQSRRSALKILGGSLLAGALPLGAVTPAFAANKRIALVVKNLGNSYFDACRDGAQQAAIENERRDDGNGHAHILPTRAARNANAASSTRRLQACTGCTEALISPASRRRTDRFR